MRVDKQVTSKVFRQVHRVGSVPAALMGGALSVADYSASTVGGFYVTQLAGDTTVDASTGRMFVLNTFPMLVACDLTAIRLRTVTATSCRVSVWRAGAKIWQSDLVTGLSAGLNDIPVSVSVLAGDLLGVWLPASGGTIRFCTMTTITSLFVSDASGSVDATSGMGVLSGAVSLEAIATKPLLAVSGDSIFEGHQAWHGPMHGAPTIQGGNIRYQPGYNIAETKGWGYQNHALGGQTFAWVRSTGAPSAFNSGATVVIIHCGINDIATSR